MRSEQQRYRQTDKQTDGQTDDRRMTHAKRNDKGEVFYQDLSVFITCRLAYNGQAQLSQRDRAMLRVIKYFAKSLKDTQAHSNWHP